MPVSRKGLSARSFSQVFLALRSAIDSSIAFPTVELFFSSGERIRGTVVDVDTSKQVLLVMDVSSNEPSATFIPYASLDAVTLISIEKYPDFIKLLNKA